MICQIMGSCDNEAVHEFTRSDYWSATHYFLCEFHFEMWQRAQAAPSLGEFWQEWNRPALPLENLETFWKNEPRPEAG